MSFRIDLIEHPSKHGGETLFVTVDKMMEPQIRAKRAAFKKYYPTEFKKQYLTPVEAQKLCFSEPLQRWIHANSKEDVERQKFNEYSNQMIEELVNTYTRSNGAKMLVDFLESIPNFDIKLTDEEKNAIGQPGNVLLSGRSGTGKTLCAILRLFAMQMTFKFNLQKAKLKHAGILSDTKFSADDIDDTLNLLCVFAANSPVLANEASGYYQNLMDHIKTELKKKEKRVKERKKKAFEEQKTEEEKPKAKEDDAQIILNDEQKISEIEEQEEVKAERRLDEAAVEKKSEETRKTQNYKDLKNISVRMIF